MFKTIMVATDGSQTIIRTAALAVGLARLSRGSIIAIYVVDVYRLAHLPGYTALPSLSSRLMELMLKEGELAISEVGNMASDEGVPFDSIIAEGDPSQEIIKRSHKAGADLLVLGRIGRSDLEKIMLGCVAEKVVRHSKIPVLIVPAMSK